MQRQVHVSFPVGLSRTLLEMDGLDISLPVTLSQQEKQTNKQKTRMHQAQLTMTNQAGTELSPHKLL